MTDERWMGSVDAKLDEVSRNQEAIWRKLNLLHHDQAELSSEVRAINAQARVAGTIAGFIGAVFGWVTSLLLTLWLKK